MSVTTVLGPIDSADLGKVNMHDHLMILDNPMNLADRDTLLNDEVEAVEEAVAFVEAGGGTIVDAMPSASGRDPEGLRSIAEASGVNIVAVAGFHKLEYYSLWHWARRYELDQITELLLSECVDGLDSYDYCGPAVRRTTVKPGLLKVACGYNAIRPRESMWIEAVAAAHRSTGLSVLVHADHGTIPLQIIGRLRDFGVSPTSVAISHADRNPDMSLHLEIAATGAHICYDGLARERYRPISSVAKAIRHVCDEGYVDQILIGGDTARRSGRRRLGGLGIAGVLDSLIPDLIRSGVNETALERAVTANAAKFLATEPKSEIEGGLP